MFYTEQQHRLTLYASTEVPTDTSLTWEYSSDNGNTWSPISLGADLELDSIITSIVLRAKIQTSRPEVSPVIALDSIELIGYRNDTICEYVSKNIETDSNFSTIKQVISAYVPTGTSFNIYYSVDGNGARWASATQEGEPIVLDAQGYKQYTFIASVPSANKYRVRIRMETNSSYTRPKFKNLMNILK